MGVVAGVFAAVMSVVTSLLAVEASPPPAMAAAISGPQIVVVSEGSSTVRVEVESPAAAITLMAVMGTRPGAVAEFDQFFALLDVTAGPLPVAAALTVVGADGPLPDRFRVAVIDSGVDPVFVPTAPGFDAITGEELEVSFDRHWHGTAVAEVLASRSGPGVAPQATVVPVLACSEGCWMSHVARGVDWAVAAGVDVINLSLGSPFRSVVLERSVRRALDAGVVVVAAAGNFGAACTSGGRGLCGDPLLYPAGFAGVVSVAALDAAGELTSFTNRTGADVAAPGDVLLTGVAPAPVSGSSFAAPFVTATLGAMRVRFPEATNAEVVAGLVAAAKGGEVPTLAVDAALRDGPQMAASADGVRSAPVVTERGPAPMRPSVPSLPPPSPGVSPPSLPPPSTTVSPSDRFRFRVAAALIPAGPRVVVAGFSSSRLVVVERAVGSTFRPMVVVPVRDGRFRQVMTLPSGSRLRVTAGLAVSSVLMVP